MIENKDWHEIAEEEFVFGPDPIDGGKDDDQYTTDFDTLEAILGREICNVDDHLEAIKLGNAEWFKYATAHGVDPSAIFHL